MFLLLLCSWPSTFYSVISVYYCEMGETFSLGPLTSQVLVYVAYFSISSTDNHIRNKLPVQSKNLSEKLWRLRFFCCFFNFFLYLDIRKGNKVLCLIKHSLSIGRFIFGALFLWFYLGWLFLSLPGQSVDITSLGFWNLDQYGRIEFSH